MASHSENSRLPIAWVILHSLALVSVTISLLTGLRFSVLNKPWLGWLPTWLPQGEIHTLHVMSGFTLTATLILYLFYPYSPASKNSSPKNSNQKNNVDFHRTVIRIGYYLIPATLMTGWLHYLEILLWEELGFIHFLLALAMLFYFFIHGGGFFIQFGLTALKRVIVPSTQLGIKNFSLVIIATLSVGGIVVLLNQPNSLRSNQLNVASIGLDQIITIDGMGSEAAWKQAIPLSIMTHGGANFENGSSEVTIKAMENGDDVYLLISWQDPTKSLKHLPLIKNSDGWSVMEDGFYEFDEQRYYEDKFAIMLSTNCQMAGAETAHLGPKPIPHKPSNWHGKGYHYTKDGSIRDVWHWKAVRTNDMYQADDNYFSGPDIIRHGQRRYNAGYYQDGKESGSYVMNWKWYSPEGVTPKRLPKQSEGLAPYQNNTPSLSWVAPWFDYEPYDKKKDTFSVGTIMPSVFYSSNQFEGDRADVRARGRWQDGVWTLELSRRVITGSKYDVPFDEGNCLWVAAFDHSQIAHTRHNQPIKLVMQEND